MLALPGSLLNGICSGAVGDNLSVSLSQFSLSLLVLFPAILPTPPSQGYPQLTARDPAGAARIINYTARATDLLRTYAIEPDFQWVWLLFRGLRPRKNNPLPNTNSLISES